MSINQERLQKLRQEFFDKGICVSDWAREHHFDKHIVYAVLSGRVKCNRGESHKVAQALGLKDQEPLPKM